MGNNGALGDNLLTFPRFQWISSFPNAPGHSVDQTQRFLELHQHYREFAITGMRIEIIPADRDTVVEYSQAG